MRNVGKSILTYVIVAVVSVAVTFATYNYLEARGNNGYANLFDTFMGQDEGQNIHLASLTAYGYPDFTKAAENSINAVVHIKSTTLEQQNSRSQYGIDPFEFFFGPGFGRSTPQQPRESVGFGSGVIISKDGYIITNNHVIDKANNIEVTLNNNSKFEAKLIGTDPLTDIALLKIEGNDFPMVPFGNSDNLKVGEWVLAIGNPFNLTSTVTAGIVSAKSRSNVGGGGIRSFIQTDAAINRGNSGGALVDTQGRLVGINTMIYSQTGDFAGYGFAVPISIAGKVVADLKEFGAVQRAVLGVVITDIAAAKEQFPDKTKDLKLNEGAYIAEFAERSPAKEAGLQEGDIITSIEGVKIRNVGELQDQVNRYRPGNKISVGYKRGNSDKTVEIVLKNNSGSTSIIKKTDPLASLGAAFKELSNEDKRKYGVSYGIEVAGVDSDGKFSKHGISKGFIILKLNDQRISSIEEIEKIIQQVGGAQDKGLFISGFYPNGKTKFYAIDLGE